MLRKPMRSGIKIIETKMRLNQDKTEKMMVERKEKG